VVSRQPQDALDAEIRRGQRLDREVARRLGRPEPDRAAPGAYVDTIGEGPALAAARERELIAAAQEGDAAARAQLVEAFMPLIGSIARGYGGTHVQRVELLQEGVVGLLRALDGFDPQRGVPFWGYASWWVRQAMQQLVAELTRPVVLSDRALRNLARLRVAHDDALQRSGREPSRAELAERTGLTPGQVGDLLPADRTPRSFDEPVSDDDGLIGTFGELIVDPLAEGEYERVLAEVEVEELHALLAGLSDRERAVLAARYGFEGDEQSLRQVGDRLGLSAERVRQIEQRALGKLAAVLDAPPPPS
jgi:RNA polymerase primary sigma factor